MLVIKLIARDPLIYSRSHFQFVCWVSFWIGWFTQQYCLVSNDPYSFTVTNCDILQHRTLPIITCSPITQWSKLTFLQQYWINKILDSIFVFYRFTRFQYMNGVRYLELCTVSSCKVFLCFSKRSLWTWCSCWFCQHQSNALEFISEKTSGVIDYLRRFASP